MRNKTEQKSAAVRSCLWIDIISPPRLLRSNLDRLPYGKMLVPKPSLKSVWLVLLLYFAAALTSFGADEKPPPERLPANVEVFTVKTRSEENREVYFYVRRPAGYDPADKERGKVHRILFISPVYNGNGLTVIKSHSLIPLADARGWFVVSPTFKQQGADVRDRKRSYYYPETFSGPAVVAALELIAKKYPVDINRLLLKGLSGGAQFVHRFALWAPERVTAVAINSSSWFDEPNPKVTRLAWLVTIGESDNSYNNSIEFVAKLRDAGASPLFRSFLGMVHEGDARVSKLNAEFLAFYDDLTAGDLGKQISLTDRANPKLAKSGMDMPFVGDSQTWAFYPNTLEYRENIPEENRIFLPNEVVANLWGKQEDE